MLFGAKALASADDAFAPRQMHSAMGATHHVLAGSVCRRFFPLDLAAMAFDEVVNNPDAQSKKYQLDQHHSAPVNEAPQDSRDSDMNWSG